MIIYNIPIYSDLINLIQAKQWRRDGRGLRQTRLPLPPISHLSQFSNSSKSGEKGGGTVAVQLRKIVCSGCFIILGIQSNINPENPGNCISGNLNFKIFLEEHNPGPPWLAPSARDCPPQVGALPPPLKRNSPPQLSITAQLYGKVRQNRFAI